MLLIRLGATPIYILDEAKNAECAREMMQRSDWVVPTFNGELRTDKPPLHYFFMIASYRLFGVNEFAARFFSVVMGLLTVWVTFHYTKKFLHPFAAFCAAVVLISSSHFLFEFRLAVPDPYLIFFITLGLLSGFTWIEEQHNGQLYIASFSLSMACLAKGPVALALPGLSLLIWIVYRKKWRAVFSWHLLLAFLLWVALTLPWYVAVNNATAGAWTKGFFLNHNLNRFSEPQEGHGGFFLITVLFVAIGLLPFMAFAGEVFKERRGVFRPAFVRFCAIVVLVFVVFFSVSSTKLPNYPMPCYAFAAVILGHFLAGLLNGDFRSRKYPYLILLVFTLVVSVGGYFAIGTEAETEGLGVVALVLLVAPLILTAAFFFARGWQHRVSFIFVAYALFNLLGIAYVYPRLYSQNPVAKTMSIIKRHPSVYSYYTFNPGYRYYVDRNIPTTMNKDTLKQWIDSAQDPIVITTAEYVDSLRSLPLTEIARHHDIFELPTTIILKKNAQP